MWLFLTHSLVIFFFPYSPPSPPHPDKPPSHSRELDYGSISGPFWSISGRFGSVWVRFGSVSGLFRVCCGVLGGVGVGSGKRASVREKNITNIV